MVFIDLEKVYDRVARDVLWIDLDKKGVCVANIKVIQDMYDGVLSKVKILKCETNDFPIRIDLHQGSPLSPYLFNLVIDVLTESIIEDVPMCMLFTDDIVLLAESR